MTPNKKALAMERRGLICVCAVWSRTNFGEGSIDMSNVPANGGRGQPRKRRKPISKTAAAKAARLAKTPLRKTDWWPDLLEGIWRKSHEPFEMDAVIIGRDLVIFDCPICGRHKHVHGHTPDELPGATTSRMSHCKGVSVGILLHIKAPVEVS